MKSFARAVGAVHAEEVTGEERCFAAAGSRPDFEEAWQVGKWVLGCEGCS